MKYLVVQLKNANGGDIWETLPVNNEAVSIGTVELREKIDEHTLDIKK